ncbi:TonB-dependent receptor [Rufibacter sp. DG15C]|uniref:TonB-dependent receptor domain-containing protein n=1 Tax=Rufibacter sp. DG15C TaxID=1379909 RepID=UPI00078E5559|nr:TonB-dependent receptor [Rufibacter sp. DG15C]AMM52284.1 TonB-dependent receptor [Rufibacter sp. DG15C]
MKNIFSFLFSFLFFSLSLAVHAQTPGSLTGLVKDEKGEPLSYGTIALLKNPGATVVNGAGIEVDGSFKLPSPAAGTYVLRLSVMGFQTLETAPFTVSEVGFTKNFGTLVVKSDAKQLNEVTVEAMRPTIINHPDKMVVSVEGTAMAAGSTALEVLAKSPGVWVDQDGNIQLNGKAGVKVMIDGKLTYLSGKQLQTMLQSMPADNVKDLEIISNPSSKFDAEGNSGIININLKRNTQTGFNGSVYSGYQYNRMHGYNAGGNVNYKEKNWSTFASADMARRVNWRKNTMYREFNFSDTKTIFDQEGDEEGIRDIPSIRLGAEVDINPKHSLGVTYNWTSLTFDNFYNTNTYLISETAANSQYIEARNTIDGRYYNGTLNGHYLYKIDTLGSTLSADIDYVTILDQDNSRFSNSYSAIGGAHPYHQEHLGSDNPTQYSIYSAKADYTKKFLNKTKLEAGLKASYVESDNLLKFYTQLGAWKANNPNRSNHFIYKENIFAGYLNYTMSLGKQWSVQAGLRAEQTVSEGYSVTLQETTPREYLDLFPSVFLQQKVNDNYQITYNYSRRIQRPNYDRLNPFVFYLDPLTWAQGNPQLRPQYSNSVQVSQTWKNTYILTLGYSKTTDFIAEIPIQRNESNTTVFGPRNVDDHDSYFGTVIAPMKVSNKWDMNNTLTTGYQKFSIVLEEARQENKQFYYMVNSNHNIQLPYKTRLELNAGYQGPNAYGLYKIDQTWWIDAGVKRSFFEDKLEASLSVTDIFKTRRVIGSANLGENVNSFDQYFGAQSVKLNLRYRFNKGEKFEMKRRNTNLDELNRAGG